MGVYKITHFGDTLCTQLVMKIVQFQNCCPLAVKITMEKCVNKSNVAHFLTSNFYSSAAVWTYDNTFLGVV